MEAGHAPHGGHVLAGEPAADHIDGLNLAPVDRGDVTQVRHARPVVREYARRGRVELGEPHRFAVEHFLDGEVEAAVAGEQRPDPQPTAAGLVVWLAHENSGRW